MAPERVAAVAATGQREWSPNQVLDQLTDRASKLLKAPIALITLVDEATDLIKSQVGMPDQIAGKHRIDDEPTFCQLTVAQREPVVINDALAVPTLRLFPSVASGGVRAHMGVPLEVDGQMIGNCCVIDYKPRQWTEAEVAELRQIAQEALSEIVAGSPAKK